MKPTDFAYYLSAFFTKYLPNECGSSPNTVSSYRDTFLLLFSYLRDKKGIRIEKLQLQDLQKNLVREFLDWIENGRHCSVATRNGRVEQSGYPL